MDSRHLQSPLLLGKFTPNRGNLNAISIGVFTLTTLVSTIGITNRAHSN